MKEKNKSKHIFRLIYIIVITIIFAVLPQVVQPTNSIWFVSRATYCFGAIYGILVLLMAVSYDFHHILKYIIIFASIFFLILELESFIKIEKDRYILNQKDYEITNIIQQKIEEYETNTHNKISKIMVYKDLDPQYTYSNIFATGDINIKSYFANWSIEAILNYYLKRDMHVINEEKETNKNWNEFNSEEQVLFDKDTLIIYKY